MMYSNLPAKATLKPTPFEAHVSEAQINKFKQLLELSEFGPKTYENTTDEKYFGVTYEWLEGAKEYWERKYDWRKTEDRINSYPNYKVDIKDGDGEVYNVHFIALFSDRNDAIPITFLHGWPGSFLEFLDLLDVVKSKYPSASDLPFHLIVPSLPGYGYSSSASLKKNLRMEDVASVIDKLMIGLGFEDGYVSQGGDIGSMVTRILVAKYPSCKAAHLNFCIMGPPKDVPESAVNAAEKQALQRLFDFGSSGNAYAREHGTRPSTIGFVLSSSPLALLAWIAEKFQTWTDPSSTPPMHAILDSVSLYWYTQTFPRAVYPYRQMEDNVHTNRDYHIQAPKVFGYSFFPMELGPIPKAWAETTGNMVWHRQHSSGGHFASMEKPQELWADVEEFVTQIWKGTETAKL